MRHRGVRAGLLAVRLQLLQHEVGINGAEWQTSRNLELYAVTNNLSHVSKFSICYDTESELGASNCKFMLELRY